jgi:hypothetical protein
MPHLRRALVPEDPIIGTYPLLHFPVWENTVLIAEFETFFALRLLQKA